MVKHKHLDALIQQLVDTLPPGVQALRQDIEKNFRSILEHALAKLDLVTREEFDAQVNVLQRTREKLEALERKLKAFEHHPKEH